MLNPRCFALLTALALIAGAMWLSASAVRMPMSYATLTDRSEP